MFWTMNFDLIVLLAVLAYNGGLASPIMTAQLLAAAHNCAPCDRNTIGAPHVYMMGDEHIRTKQEFVCLPAAVRTMQFATTMRSVHTMFTCVGTNTSALCGKLRE